MTVAGSAAACGLGLAIVFLAAALSKMGRRSAVTESFAAMGLVAPEALAVLVPILELATAVLLVLWPLGGAGLALLLLVAFTVVLARLVASGVSVGCACFGSTSNAPVSFVELVRNAGLMMMAIAVITMGDFGESLGWPGVADVLFVAALMGVGALVLRLLRNLDRSGGG